MIRRLIILLLIVGCEEPEDVDANTLGKQICQANHLGLVHASFYIGIIGEFEGQSILDTTKSFENICDDCVIKPFSNLSECEKECPATFPFSWYDTTGIATPTEADINSVIFTMSCIPHTP